MTVRPWQDNRLHWLVIPASTAFVGILCVAVLFAVSANVLKGATPADQLMPTYSMKLSNNGESIHLNGYIDHGATQALSSLLQQATQVENLQLQSPGGLVAEARGLVRVVQEFGLSTSALGDCVSACTLVFMAGHTRYLEPDARLGFHRYAQKSALMEYLMKLDPVEEQQRDFSLFRNAEVDDAFLARIMDTPHQQMWYPSTQELMSSGVVDVMGLPAEQRN